ncbi:MAG: sulfatase-like hydrolase/transferase [Planctomycetota bacterium]
MKPDLLLICLDQLSALAIGRGDTPTIDALAAGDSSFTTAVTACPLCMPARASFWSGLLPHRTGVTSNGRWAAVPKWPTGRKTLGRILTASGYACRHVGKCHDAGSLDGFTCVPETEQHIAAEHPAWPLHGDSLRDVATTTAACAILAEPAGDAPRCLAVDLNNPHDICGWIGDYQKSLCRVDPPGELPELPFNHAPADPAVLPRSLQYVCCAHNRQAQVTDFTTTDWRRYIAAYRHYVRRADADVATILAALRSSGRADRTLVLLWTDHGDGMGAHALATKHTSFYEESVRVPFIVTGPGVPAGQLVNDTLVSLTDLLPTICGLVGADVPACDGVDLSGWLGAARPRQVRSQVVSEWWSEWGSTVEPGRMLRDGRWKYVHYREDGREQLFDLAADPGEMTDLARDSAHIDQLVQMRAALEAHIAATADPYPTLAAQADPRWRTHAPGQLQHVGPTAPQIWEQRRRS